MNFIKKLFQGQVEHVRDEVKDWQDPDREEVPTVCDEITIEGVGEDLHSKLMGQAVSAGAAFDGDTATLHGIVLNWSWDEPSGMLHITALRHPFYLSCGEIESKIRDLVEKAKTGI